MAPVEQHLRVASEPGRQDGVPSWEFARGLFRVRFLGVGASARGAALDAGAALRWAPGTEAAAWLRQRHSALVVDAEPGGERGEGDALVVTSARLAALVVTADCVPVVLAGRRVGAAVHAGWRGVVAGVVPNALARLRAAGEDDVAAWIGPAIGGCCYEVGSDVAAAVVAASDAGALEAAGELSTAKPRVDLRRAVAHQLAAGGVTDTTLVDVCTRCHPELLWSYRRDGERAGRNLTLVWRVSA